jgi:4-amino-4-deoxy-L-arabinose transferase-like glycosyltransferase
MWWTVGGFAAHLAFGLLVINTNLFVYLGSDSLTYHRGAGALLRHLTQGAPEPRLLTPGKSGFFYLLAGIYWIFGQHVSAGLVVNAAFAAALVPVMTDLTRRLFGLSTARYIPALVTLLPGIFIWTSQLLKEAPILLLIAVAANCGVRLTKRTSPGALIGLALSLGLLFTFRSWVALLLSAGIAATIPLSSTHLGRGVTSGVGAVSALALVIVALGLGYSGYRVAAGANLQQAQLVHQGLSVGVGSGFAEDVDISTTGGALAYAPQGFVHFTLGPFPWEISGLRQIPGFLDVLAWWLLIPAFWRGWRMSRSLIRRGAFILVIPALAITLMFSLSVSNFGSVARERPQVLLLLLPLIALGLAHRQKEPSSDRTRVREAQAAA